MDLSSIETKYNYQDSLRESNSINLKAQLQPNSNWKDQKARV